jgi:hypothetical protein
MARLKIGICGSRVGGSAAEIALLQASETAACLTHRICRLWDTGEETSRLT